MDEGNVKVLLQAEDQADPQINNLIGTLMKLESVVEKNTTAISKMVSPIRKVTHAVKEQTGAFGKLASSIKRIAFYRAIRSALKAVTQGLREGTNNLVLYSQALANTDSASANKTMSDFATTALYVKNSLATALMPLLQMLVPVVNAIANAFVFAANAVNQFFHALKGDTVFTKAKKYTVDYANSLNKASGAAKELKKQVFGFDELNIFNSPSSSGGGGGGGLDPTKMFEESAISENWGKIADLVKNNLEEITLIVSAATLAVGAILALSGIKPTLGIALMAAGAIGLAAGTANWNIMDGTLKPILTKIEGTVGGFLMAIGAILALSNANIPLGIAMLALGAVSVASAIAINWDFLGSSVEDKIAFITGIVGAAVFFLGALFAIFSPAHLGLGIALLVGGALGMATPVSMSDNLKGLIKQHIGDIEAIIGVAALFLGVVAAFTGHIPVGLGLIALGAIALNKGTANLSDQLKQKIGDKLNAIKDIVQKATIAIGALLTIAGFPQFGIPLLITGLALTGSDVDWDALNNKIKAKWEAVKQTGRNIVSDIKGFVEKVKNFFRTLLNFNANITLTPSMQNGINTPSNAGRFAEGGSPQMGSLFWAGEQGPELIGQIGNRTTVTNEAQFAAGMEDILDNTNTVIMQVGQAVVQAILSKDMTVINNISERAIVNAYDKGKRLGGTGLATGSGIV